MEPGWYPCGQLALEEERKCHLTEVNTQAHSQAPPTWLPLAWRADKCVLEL